MRRGVWSRRVASRSAREDGSSIPRMPAARSGSALSLPEALVPPAPERAGVVAWVERNLAPILRGQVEASPIVGGQTAADAALASVDITGYAHRRNEVWPIHRRGASGLSPYIRHGLLSLPRVWKTVEGPPSDRDKFRDELLWQEYARHLYARLGTATRHALRFAVREHSDGESRSAWPRGALCIEASVRELRETGWITNQQRMWLASHWSVREGLGWRDGEDEFFRHLLDGSRAANRLGWQWTSGALTGKPYGFSRWQVTHRAPGMCAECALRDACPIEDWPDAPEPAPRTVVDPRIRRDPDPAATAGPTRPEVLDDVDCAWITAESLGDDDPALAAHPDVPVVFVFDLSLLARLRVAPQRLVFLVECLADLATRREVAVYVDDPVAVLRERKPAVTFTPVPGWHARVARIPVAAVHPWPWLRPVGAGPLTSFSAWRTSASRASGARRGRR